MFITRSVLCNLAKPFHCFIKNTLINIIQKAWIFERLAKNKQLNNYMYSTVWCFLSYLALNVVTFLLCTCWGKSLAFISESPDYFTQFKILKYYTVTTHKHTLRKNKLKTIQLYCYCFTPVEQVTIDFLIHKNLIHVSEYSLATRWLQNILSWNLSTLIWSSWALNFFKVDWFSWFDLWLQTKQIK